MKQWAIVGLTILGGSVGGVGCSGGGMAAPSAEGDLVKNTSAISTRTLATNTQFFVPAPQPGAVQQVANLLKAKDLLNAARVAAMAVTPQAVWFESGSPADVQKSVKKTMAQAALEKRVPILVSYNIPYRDCAQYSTGGALDTPSYEAWIDGFAAGIGKGKAVVILEPDGLGLIPYNTTIYGAAEWCQPTLPAGTTAQQLNQARYTQLNYAVDSIESKAPNAQVYLDATHSAWLGTGEAAYRLFQAGVQRADGFFLNVSNYQPTDQSIQFGTWVSMCLAFATNPDEGGWRLNNFSWCASQYNPATNYAIDYSAAWETQVTAQIQGMMGNAVATTRFVIDTSRNGNGPLNAASYGLAPYNQPASVVSALNGTWCNPPGAGLGLRPSANTGVPLLDAYLWVKTPGESDGSCDIAGGARAWNYGDYDPWPSTIDQNHFDPLWGIVDPAAGAWFPQQALQLVKLANPKLR